MSSKGILLPGAAFVFALVISAAGIQFFLPPRLELYSSFRSEKVAILRAHIDEMTSAAFGSSHVHDGFDPRSFDQELKAGGYSGRSYNLAIAAGPQAEELAMVREYLRNLPLAKDPPSPRFVFLELNEGLNFGPPYLYDTRSINLYDLRTIQFVFACDPPGYGWTSVAHKSYALLAGILYFLNLGMLSNAIFQPPLGKDILECETVNDRRGLITWPPPSPETKQTIRKLFQQRPATPRIVPASIPVETGPFLRSLVLDSRRKGVQFVYVVTPDLSNLEARPEYPESLQGPDGRIPIVNLACPDLYPEMFQEDLWRDVSHVNEAGAGVISKRWAQLIASWYRKSTNDQATHAVR